MTTHVQLDIAAPPERVFHCIEDFDTRRRWAKGLVEQEILSEGENGPVGTRFMERIQEGGRLTDYHGEVTAHQRPTNLAVTLGNDHFTMYIDYTLQELPNGTRLAFTVDTRNHSWMAKLVGFMARRMLNGIAERQMDSLKKLAERLEVEGATP